MEQKQQADWYQKFTAPGYPGSSPLLHQGQRPVFGSCLWLFAAYHPLSLLTFLSIFSSICKEKAKKKNQNIIIKKKLTPNLLDLRSFSVHTLRTAGWFYLLKCGVELVGSLFWIISRWLCGFGLNPAAELAVGSVLQWQLAPNSCIRTVAAYCSFSSGHLYY